MRSWSVDLSSWLYGVSLSSALFARHQPPVTLTVAQGPPSCIILKVASFVASFVDSCRCLQNCEVLFMGLLRDKGDQATGWLLVSQEKLSMSHCNKQWSPKIHTITLTTIICNNYQLAEASTLFVWMTCIQKFRSCTYYNSTIKSAGMLSYE